MPGQQGFEPGPAAQNRHPPERNADNWQEGRMGRQLCSQQERTASFSTEQFPRCRPLGAVSDHNVPTLLNYRQEEGAAVLATSHVCSVT